MNTTNAKDWLYNNDIKSFEIKDEKTQNPESFVNYILDNIDQNFDQILGDVDLISSGNKPPVLVIAILLYNSRIYKGYTSKEAYIDLKNYFKSEAEFKHIVKQFPELQFEVIPEAIQEIPTTPEKTQESSIYLTVNPREIPIELEGGTTNLYDLIANYNDLAQIYNLLLSIGIPSKLILFIWYETHKKIILYDIWDSEIRFLEDYTSYIQQFQKDVIVQEVKSNIFDSEITLAYKYAKNYNIPPRFIYKAGNSYYSIFQNFTEFKGTLDQIYSQITELTPDLDTTDVANLYYKFNENNPALMDNINSFLDTEYNLSEFIEIYDQWIYKLGIQLQETQKLVNIINNIQNTLLAIQPTSLQSAFRLNQITLLILPTHKNTKIPITSIDGIDIFNNAIPNSLIPYITYVNDTQKLTKIYTGKIYENNEVIRKTPNYDIIIPDFTLMNESYKMYFQYWVEQKGEPGKTSYKLIKYDLQRNELILPFRDKLVKSQKLEILSKLRPVLGVFPMLDFKNYSIKSMDGEIEIYNETYGVEINPTSFLHLILLDPLFNTYIYVSEVSESANNQRSLVLRYNSYLEREIKVEKSVASQLTATIIQQKGKRSANYTILEGKQQIKKTFEFDMPYIKLEIANAKDNNVIRQFIDIFLRLLQTYFEKKNAIENLYNNILGSQNSVNSSRSQSVSSLGVSINSLKIASSRPSIASTGERDKLRELQMYRAFKEAKNYSRFCQKKLAPIIIPPEDREAWEKRTYKDKNGNSVNLRVLEFHTKDEGVLLVGCDPETYDSQGNRKAEPYFKKNEGNTATANKNDYPYLPCCGSKREDYKSNMELLGIKPIIPTETSKIKSGGSLELGNIGNISKLLERFLGTSVSDSLSIIRRGVLEGSNNLLHCLLTALDPDKNYNNATQIDKNKIATRFRSQIVKQYSPLLCKAELYDYTETEILDSLNNDKLDPELHYRILEEAFNINIWTFYEPTPNFQTLLIPRHKLFHIRSFNSRNNILLFRSETTFENFSTSLIVASSQENKVHGLFGVNTGIILYKLFLALHSHNLTLFTNKLETYSNLCNLLDYSKLFNKPEAQILDNYGKLIAVLIRIDNQLATIGVLPGAPLNLPTAEATEISVDTILPYFKDPPYSAVYENGKGVGLWYSAFDYKMAFFVRTKPWDSINYKGVLLELPQGNPDPLPKKYNIITEYRKVQRLAKILFQLIEWVYILGYVQYKKSWLSEFSNLLQVSEGEYIFNDINYILPIMESYSQAIEWIKSKAPTLIIRDKIRISSTNLKNKILDKLREFNKGIEGIIPEIPTEMVQLYTYVSDFKKFRNVMIFLSFEEVTKWRNSINNILLNNYIYTEINNDMFRLNYPIMFRNERLWIIQNNFTHTLETALYISEYWNLNKINLGYTVETTIATQMTNIDYILYNITIEHQLIAISGNLNSNNHIIQTSDGKFSSLLLVL